jgi:hypothetical protein
MNKIKKILVSAGSALALIASTLVVGGTPAQAALTYLYAQGAETKTETGAAVLITVASPTVTAGDFHSLAQMAVFSSDLQQVVEVGWSVDPATFSDNNPHLFATRWTNGAFGGYSDTSWVDYAPNAVNKGASLALDVGSLKAFQISFDGSNNIWVYYNGVAVGHFPASDWTSPTFTTGSKWKFWGEVAANVASPTTLMGTGTCSAAAGAAKFSSVTYADSSTGNLSLSATDTSKYTTTAISAKSFYFGGDGSCP